MRFKYTAIFLVFAAIAGLSSKACVASSADRPQYKAAPPQLPVAPRQLPLEASARFYSEVNAYTNYDQQFGTSSCGTLFVGSSTIRLWDSLSRDFPSVSAVNRGFGGSEITDVTAYFDRLVTPHSPREIVFYAGENDLTGGRPAADVVEHFQDFMRLKTVRLGNTPVYFISAKPSPSRVNNLAAQTELNQMMASYAQSRHDLTFVDIVGPMFSGRNLKPVFIADNLHMNREGYKIWTKVLGPYLYNARRPRAEYCYR